MSLPFVPRDEDPRLLTGAGRFVDDERASGEAHGVFVRSPHAFAAIRAIDGTAARALPGVLAVLTAADMERAGVGNVTLGVPVPERGRNGGAAPSAARRRHGAPCRRSGGARRRRDRGGRARRRRAGRRRLCRAVDPVTDVAAAGSAAGARRSGPKRRAISRSIGTGSPRRRRPGRARATIFADAAHVARVRLVNQRIVMAPMEPRGALAVYDRESRPLHPVTAPRKAPSSCASTLPHSLGVPAERVRVVSGDVGGAFGMRATALSRIPGAPARGAADRAGRCAGWSTRSEGVPHRQPGARHDHRGDPRARRRRPVSRRSISTCSPVWAPT